MAPSHIRTTTTVRWRIVIAVSDRFKTNGPWSNTEMHPTHIGSASAARSTLEASTRGESTTYKVSITTTAGNAIAFLNSKSRRSNTWRPNTGIAEHTIRSAFYHRYYRRLRTIRLMWHMTYCRYSGLRLLSNRTTARATITTFAQHAKRSVSLTFPHCVVISSTARN